MLPPACCPARGQRRSTAAQFQVDNTARAATSGGTDAAKEARNSEVVMDSQGNFFVVWESYSDTDTILNANGTTTISGSYGVFYSEFNAAGTAVAAATGEANQIFASPDFTGSQVNPSVGVDANGNFTVAWDGNGAQPAATDTGTLTPSSVTTPDSLGVWIRTFNATTGATSVESLVNSTVGGDQKFPTVAMTPNGQAIVVWQGNGVGDPNGIYFRRYPAAISTAGPTITNVAVSGVSIPVNTSASATVTVGAAVALPIVPPATVATGDTQTITITAPAGVTGPLSGTFQLTTNSTVTVAGQTVVGQSAPIAFDSTNLTTAAANLQAALTVLFPASAPTVVSVPSAVAGTYTLQVTWTNLVNVINTAVAAIYPPAIVPTVSNTIVVTFGENMMTSGPDSVTNPKNWTLTTNGAPVTGGISSITYQLNPADNKYEATLTLGASLSSGSTYTLTALAPTYVNGVYQSGLRNAAGNPLYRSAYLPNGANVVRQFLVQVTIPAVIGFSSVDASLNYTPIGTSVPQPVTTLAVNFNENMSNKSATDVNSVTNLANYSLTLGGVPVAFSSVTYAANTVTGIYEATLTLASPLAAGTYTFTVSNNLQDTFGNPMASGYTDTFSVVGTPTQGPTVLGTYNLTAPAVRQLVNNGTVLNTTVSQMVVAFSEAMSNKGPTDPNSVTNPANWSLSVGGATVANGISSISYDPVAHEATLTFNAGTGAAAVPLGSGNYVLTAKGTIEDSYGNALAGNGAGVNGVNFTRSFSVKIDTPINITAPTGNSPVVASDANGDVVVAWVSYGQNGDAATDGNIYAQLYTKLGQPVGTQILVNSFTTGTQIDPAVAMNAGGTFVVAWSGEAADGSMGVSARAFNVAGTPLGDQFLVNQFPNNDQSAPSVAINAAGNVVITWTSYSQSPDTGYNGIWARSFNILQGPPAATNAEFLVNTSLAYNHDDSSVAMAANGNFTVVWQSFGQDGSDWGVFGQRFNSADAKLGGEFQVNTYTTDKQMLPKVAMDANGDTVITWESFGQDGSGWGIYARRYSPAGVALDAADVQINQHTLNYQMTPDVGIDGNGNYIITWSTYGQDNTGNPVNLGYDIYARQFNANGTNYVDPTTGTTGEFIVNATVLGDQVSPAIAVDPNHDYAIVWVGPSTTVAGSTAIFGYFNDPAPPTGPAISGVVVAPLASPPVLTWSAADPSGVGAMTLLVDGKAVSTIYGPYGSNTNANFAGLLPTGLAVGSHTYVIQAADLASTPLSSQFSGTFVVPAPEHGPNHQRRGRGPRGQHARDHLVGCRTPRAFPRYRCKSTARRSPRSTAHTARTGPRCFPRG